MAWGRASGARNRVTSEAVATTTAAPTRAAQTRVVRGFLSPGGTTAHVRVMGDSSDSDDAAMADLEEASDGDTDAS